MKYFYGLVMDKNIDGNFIPSSESGNFDFDLTIALRTMNCIFASYDDAKLFLQENNFCNSNTIFRFYIPEQSMFAFVSTLATVYGGDSNNMKLPVVVTDLFTNNLKHK